MDTVALQDGASFFTLWHVEVPLRLSSLLIVNAAVS